MMDINEITEFLPQRYPFLLVDRVTDLKVGETITGYKNVSMNEPFFPGHFPGLPIMPGVLIVEAMAQIAGILGFSTVGRKPADGYLYVFAGADKVRFKRQVVPGDCLELQASVLNEKRGIWKFDCRASVNGEQASCAEILIAERKTA